MKTLFPNRPATAVAIVKSLSIVFLLAACSEQEIKPRNAESSNESIDGLSQSSNARLSCGPERPRYNLNVILLGANKRSIGFIKFRQNVGETQLIHLDTWVHGLEPNTRYLLQRAVDTTLDGDCTGTAWLTLGKGLDPQSILTDNRGSGMEELWRSVASIPVGTTFDIHFQIVKESTLEVVLSSDCYQYIVR